MDNLTAAFGRETIADFLMLIVKKNVSPHYSQHGLCQIRAVSRTIAAWKLTN
jgi:hypothetical protein